MQSSYMIHLLAIAMLLVGAAAFAQPPSTYYVYAPNGLNLRAAADANSAKLATIPLGTAVELLAAPKTMDMKVDNLSGGMAHVRADGQEGYMFSGYLCPAPLPEEDETAEKYKERAREQGLELYYEEIHRDYGGYFQAEYAIVVDGLDWQEAYLLGKKLFGIPDGLNFPGLEGKESQTMKNPKAHPLAWTDQLSTEYDAQGKLKSIHYNYRAEATGQVVAIQRSESPEGLRISELQIAD